MRTDHHPASLLSKPLPALPNHEEPRVNAGAVSSKRYAKSQVTSTSLSVPAARRGRSQSPDTLSLLSADDFSELRRTLSIASAVDDGNDWPAVSEKQAHPGWRGKVHKSWVRNKGLALVLLAQVFGVGMNIGTRLLENLGSEAGSSGGGMHPFQILFARMSITTLLSCIYMWWTKTPDFPFGAKGVRAILVARGLGGFFGVFGLYWSLQYLPLSDATVLTFIAPFIACAVCAKLLHEPFTRIEQLGGLVSLFGVVLIARPTTLFASSSASDPTAATSTVNSTDPSSNDQGFASAPTATEAQRLAAIGMAMLGVLGAAIAYTTIRWIGTRAHPLISVNYFSTWCTIVSSVALGFIPGIPFVFPRNVTEWALLALIGVGGFVMQFLLTAGLRYEKSSRATNMVYSQMLFALAADRVIWGEIPGAWSLAGSALILGAAIVVAVQKESGGAGRRRGSGERVRRDEEAALVEGVDGVEMQDEEEREEEQRNRGRAGDEPERERMLERHSVEDDRTEGERGRHATTTTR